MSWFENDDVENGNSCYQGFGSSGSCYGCPHEADCPYNQPIESDSSMIASLSDAFAGDEDSFDGFDYEEEEEGTVICPGAENDDEETEGYYDWGRAFSD